MVGTRMKNYKKDWQEKKRLQMMFWKNAMRFLKFLKTKKIKFN